MKHTKKLRLLLTACWILLGLVLAVIIWFARNAEHLHGPLSGILFAYALLSPAIVAGMHYLKRREKQRNEQ